MITMEVQNQTVALDPLRSRFLTNHQKPYKIPKDLTFEIKVIYMRIMSAVLDIESCLNLVFLPRDLHSCLYINGFKINPSQKISRPLNRHRADALKSEYIYVNTERIKFKGFSLPFEVQVQEGCSSSVLISGVVKRKVDSNKDGCMWVMECSKQGGFGSGDDDLDGGGSSVDVYFAGGSLGKPLLLNGYLKRSQGLDGFLDQLDFDQTMSSDNTNKGLGEVQMPIHFGGGGLEHDKTTEAQAQHKGDIEEEKFHHHLQAEEQDEEGGHQGEMSWFNEGVRVGIGLGLGLFLGAGVGVGLIVRTCQATSATLKKLMM